jgi:hypothetical protein
MNETEVLKKDDEDDFEVIETTDEEDTKEPEKAPESAEKKDEPPPPEPDKEPAKKEEELSGLSDAVKKRIDKLTFKMREAERREQAALEYARSLQAETQSFKQKAQQLDQSLVSEYENRIKAQQQLVTDKFKSAVESGDVDGQVEAQKQLAALAVEEERVRVAKTQRAAPAQTQTQEPAQQQQQYQQPAPKAPKPDPRAEAWAERNEWFGQDKAMTATAFVIHSQLVEEEGFDPSGDDYYEELDRRIQGEFPHKFRKEAPVERQAPAAVASARPTGRSENNPKQIKLTRSQIEIARKLGVSVKDYARQLQKLAR